MDDASFTIPVEAVLDPESGTWHARIGALAPGEHTLHARARIDTTTSDAATSSFVVTPNEVVQWRGARDTVRTTFR